MKKTLDTDLELCYNIRMNEDDYGYDEGSDIDNWETEQVFQDHEGDDEGAHQRAFVRRRADLIRDEEMPTFFNHFQTLLRTMEKTR